MNIQITVDRKYKKPAYTIGNLYINGERLTDGKHYCNTLEDTDRGLKSSMTPAQIAKLKKYGQTAIPTGTYPVVLAWSNKFKKEMPHIERVPGYSGILIHPGNTAADTLGCILVGENTQVGRVNNSRYWFDILYRKIKETIERGSKVSITIR